jgi:GntR family transcriptional regulator
MPTPRYQQIALDLRDQIESGALKPGQQLRTELELQERYEASRNTVRDAIKWLTNLNLVETRPGSGTFVVQKIDPFVTALSGDPGAGSGEDPSYLSEVRQRHREPENSRIQVEIQEASQGVARGLWIAEGTDVISRHEKRFIDGTPWSMLTSFYPMDFVDRGADKLIKTQSIDEGTVKYLAKVLGRRQVGYRDWITVRAPDANEVDFFKLPADGRVAVYEIFRTAFDEDGRPMRLTITVYPADRNQFIVEVGPVPEAVEYEEPETAAT